MRVKGWLALMALIWMLSACSSSGEPPAEKEVISDLFNAEFKNAEAVVVSEFTTADMISQEHYDYFKQNIPELTPELLQAFQAANQQPARAAELLEIKPKVITISEDRRREIFSAPEGKGWDVFYQTYGRVPGIQSFSRPGFSQDGKYALVYLGGSYGWLAGKGDLILMEKVNGVWQVKSRVMVWIS